MAKDLREYYLERDSFCCGEDGCRKRVTTPSVRFFGYHRYAAPLVILITALKCGATKKRCEQIERLLGVLINRRTWRRWFQWWRNRFVETNFWKRMVGLIATANFKGHFPRCLLDSYSGSFQERLILTLQFLAPLTAGAERAV